MVAKERSGFSCRVSLRERSPYPLAHQRRRRNRSSIALIHIMAHVVRSRPLKGMRYGDTTEWRTSTKQATSRKSRCKLLEVDQTDEINLRRVFWNLPKSKYFANRKTRTTTKNRTTTYRTIQYAPRDAGMKYSGLTPTKCSKVRLFLVTAQARADEFLRIWRLGTR